MSGGSKKQTIGYWYKMGLHMGLCHGPADSVLEIRAGDRAAWTGDATASGQISIDAEDLFGGKEKEGGIVGLCDVMMGEPTQAANSYLSSKQTGPQPGYRGLLSLVFRGGKIAANNPYIKPWAVRVKRILQGWKGGTAWYAAKAPIELGCGDGGIPAGNTWLVYEGYAGDSFLGDYTGASYAAQAQDTTHGLIGSFLKQGTKCYQYNLDASKFFYVDESDFSDWTEISITIPSSGGGRIVSDGTYLYVAGGGNDFQRMTLPTGAFTDPSGGATYSKGGGITVHNGALFMARNNSGEFDVNKSTDNGATWTPVGVISHDKVGVAFFASNGTRLCVCYERVSDNHVVIEYSDNDGVTWSGVVYTFPSPYTSFLDAVGSGFLYDGSHFVGILLNGKTAYSANGGSWTAGGTIPRDMKYVSPGIGKIVAGCAYTELYETTDHGATWTQMAAPVGTGASTDNIYPYWIGAEGALPSSTCFKAMNPAHIVYECLTNSEWGMGYDSSIIDDASFTAAADVFFAEGLGLCLQWLRQDSIENFIKLVMDHAGAVTVEDRTTGLIQLKPLRGDYDIGTLPEFGSELGNVLEMRRFERGAVTDAINEVSVSYTAAQTGKTGSVAVQNLAAVQASGRVISQSVDYPGLPTMDLALRTALRDLRAYTSGLARVHLTVNRSGYALTPGDVIKFSWLPDGIESMVLRVIDIDYGSLTDGKVMLECLEDVFGLPATTYVAQQESSWDAPDSTPVAATAYEAFEVPFRDLVQTMGQDDAAALPVDAGYLCGVALRPAGVPLNYDLRTKVGAAAYASAGSGDWCPSATLLLAVAPLDTTLTLTDVSDLDEVDVGSALLLGTEICRVDAVDTTLNTLTVARGCLDTVPTSWPIATRVWAYDAFATPDNTQYSDAETVNAKFVTRTSSGALSEGAAPTDSVLMASRAIRPYPPGLLRFLDDLNAVTGLAYPAELAGAITTNWAHRDRLLQQDQLIDENDASIGPEASTTYTVTYYQPPATLVNTESALSGTAATAYTFPADGPAEIRVQASRGGYVSWQSAQHIFDYYRFPRITTVSGEPRITDDGSARKVI